MPTAPGTMADGGRVAAFTATNVAALGWQQAARVTGWWGGSKWQHLPFPQPPPGLGECASFAHLLLLLLSGVPVPVRRAHHSLTEVDIEDLEQLLQVGCGGGADGGGQGVCVCVEVQCWLNPSWLGLNVMAVCPRCSAGCCLVARAAPCRC